MQQYSSDTHQKLLQVLGSIQLTYMKWMFCFFSDSLKKTKKKYSTIFLKHVFFETIEGSHFFANLWRLDSLVCWQATCCGTGRKTSCCNRRKRCQCRKRCIPTTTLGKLIHSYQFHISMIFPWFDLDTQTFVSKGYMGWIHSITMAIFTIFSDFVLERLQVMPIPCLSRVSRPWRRRFLVCPRRVFFCPNQ